MEIVNTHWLQSQEAKRAILFQLDLCPKSYKMSTDSLIKTKAGRGVFSSNYLLVCTCKCIRTWWQWCVPPTSNENRCTPLLPCPDKFTFTHKYQWQSSDFKVMGAKGHSHSMPI